MSYPYPVIDVHEGGYYPEETEFTAEIEVDDTVNGLELKIAYHLVNATDLEKMIKDKKVVFCSEISVSGNVFFRNFIRSDVNRDKVILPVTIFETGSITIKSMILSKTLTNGMRFTGVVSEFTNIDFEISPGHILAVNTQKITITQDQGEAIINAISDEVSKPTIIFENDIIELRLPIDIYKTISSNVIGNGLDLICMPIIVEALGKIRADDEDCSYKWSKQLKHMCNESGMLDELLDSNGPPLIEIADTILKGLISEYVMGFKNSDSYDEA